MRNQPTRRQLLRGASAAAMATTVGPYASAGPRRSRRPGGNELLKVGLVGCGGRGTGAAANALRADENVKLVAMADVFGDHLESSLNTLSQQEELVGKIDVPEERRFTGWDAYKNVIEQCDVVLLATSPHFRPLHVRAAVEAGKHLFVEKPVATDAPGVRHMRESCALAAEKGLSIVTGLCYRYQNAKRETVRRIHDGAIGDIVGMQCTYNASGLWHRGEKPEWTEMEYQMRNWLYFTWLSGDHIAEQHIHSLDKIAWVMGSYPVKAVSSGGRIVRTEEKYGNVYDHFNTVYEFENGVRCFSSCRQWNGAATNTSDWIFGTRGKSNVQAHRIESGPAWSWRYRSDEPDDMYQNEHDALFASIREGEPINDAFMCDTTLMAILGRMAAYTGKEITWEQALQSQEDLSPPAYEWGPLPVAPVARPGLTQFV